MRRWHFQQVTTTTRSGNEPRHETSSFCSKQSVKGRSGAVPLVEQLPYKPPLHSQYSRCCTGRTCKQMAQLYDSCYRARRNDDKRSHVREGIERF